MRIFVHLLAKICAHLCAFLKNLDVRIFVRLLAKICAHLSSELLATLNFTFDPGFLRLLRQERQEIVLEEPLQRLETEMPAPY